MIMTRSRNGSRNPSRGASPVLPGASPVRRGASPVRRGASPVRRGGGPLVVMMMIGLLLLFLALRVVGCRRNPLLQTGRSLLLSPIRLLVVGQ